jgi:hypothetical protein
MSLFIGTPSLGPFFAATHFQFGGYGTLYAELKHVDYNRGVLSSAYVTKKPYKKLTLSVSARDLVPYCLNYACLLEDHQSQVGLGKYGTCL